MEVLLLTFANDSTNELPTLASEYSALVRILSRRKLKGHFVSWTINYATFNGLMDAIRECRNQLSLFLFSGHAGRNNVHMEDGDVKKEGIVQLLGQCPNLKVVILNGCSTVGQVKALHQAGVPLVIATHAPVGDSLATEFSKQLFLNLEIGYTIEQAFELAIASAIGKEKLHIDRGLGWDVEQTDEKPLWGIKQNPDKPDMLGWKLPESVVPSGEPFIANDLLLHELYYIFRETNPALRKLEEDGATLENNFGDIRAAILKALPAPISERIRKLLASSREGEIGFDNIGLPRLEQLGLTYEVTILFLANLLLAQLWENQLVNPEQWQLLPPIKSGLQNVVDTNLNATIDTLEKLMDAVECHCTNPFVEEILTFRQNFLQDEDIKAACHFLENLPNLSKTLAAHEIPGLCQRAEEAVVLFFSKLGFLGRYLLATVRSIDVLKYRSKKVPEYEHLITKWHDGVYSCEQNISKHISVMDNRSVVLLRQDDAQNLGHFLSLAPFIIDENTFVKEADNTSVTLYFFTSRNPTSGQVLYTFVNSPNRRWLDLDATTPAPHDRRGQKKNKYQLAKDQFEDFYSTIVK